LTTLDLLDRLLEHDAWATRKVIDYMELLSEEQLDLNFDIGHRSIRKTFQHMLGNTETWTDLMAGRTPRRSAFTGQSTLELQKRFESAFADFAQISRSLRDAQRLNETYLDVLDEPPKRKTFGGTILHVLTHDHMHRAEILHMLQRLGMQGLIEGDVLSWEATLDK